MPTGRYTHLDPVLGDVRAFERFSCGAGPAGWRYVSTIVDPEGRPRGSLDLTCDSRWHQLRVELRADGWWLRGGAVGGQLLWRRAPIVAAGRLATEQFGWPEQAEQVRPAEPAERAERASGFTGISPAFLVAAAGLLELRPGAASRLRVLRVGGAALGVLTEEESWRLVDVTTHLTDDGPLPLEHYEVTNASTGERAAVHLAGDVVVSGPDMELRELDGPPALGLRRAPLSVS